MNKKEAIEKLYKCIDDTAHWCYLELMTRVEEEIENFLTTELRTPLQLVLESVFEEDDHRGVNLAYMNTKYVRILAEKIKEKIEAEGFTVSYYIDVEKENHCVIDISWKEDE